MPGPSPFTDDDVEQILRVVDRLNDVEVTFEHGDLRLHVRKSSGAGFAPADAGAAPAEPGVSRGVPAALPAASAAPGRVPQPPAASLPAAASARLPEGAVAIRAPMLGTFYRAPSPADPPYVEVGKRIRAGDPLCVIEVMKLFNTINAQQGGTILEIAAENGAMVEFSQLLFVLRPDA